MSEQSIDATDDGPSTSAGASDNGGQGASTSRWKRAAAGVLGGSLVALGLRRRSLGGAAMALVGGWLSYRAVTGSGRRAGESDANEERERHGAEASANSSTVERSVTVGKPADELSELLRDAENLGAIGGHFAEISSAGEDRQRWTVHGPLDRSLSWETRLVEEAPDEHLRWEPIEGRAPFEEGSAHFRPAPGDRGTIVSFRLRLDPPGGALGTAAMERLGVVPETLVDVALDRFKSLAETGEVPTLERNPSARGTGDLV